MGTNFNVVQQLLMSSSSAAASALSDFKNPYATTAAAVQVGDGTTEGVRLTYLMMEQQVSIKTRTKKNSTDDADNF